jgi:hypothetical protein
LLSRLPAAPAPQGAVQGQTQRSCVSRRRFSIRIRVPQLTNGKKITGKRTYHTCIPKLPGDGPPKV